MKHKRLIVTIGMIFVMAASFAYAEEVVIDDAFTMNQYQDPETEFYVWDPVMYQVDFTITGTAGQTYKAVIIIKSMGDTLREVQNHLPGSYSVNMLNLAGSGDVGTHTVKYTVKLKKGRTLLDVDTDTSQITVNP